MSALRAETAPREHDASQAAGSGQGAPNIEVCGKSVFTAANNVPSEFSRGLTAGPLHDGKIAPPMIGPIEYPGKGCNLVGLSAMEHPHTLEIRTMKIWTTFSYF